MSTTETITTEWLAIPVRLGDDTSVMQAYLARPAGPVRGPAVLVGFEMFGVTGFVRSVTDRLAAAGHVALAPDFYHWQSAGPEHVELAGDAGGRARGLDLINRLRRDQVVADVRAAADALASPHDDDSQHSRASVAFFGMSAGAHIGYFAATQVPLAALIALYPGWLTETGTGLSRDEPVLDGTANIAAHGTPVLFLAGADDHLFGPGQLDSIGARLAATEVPHEMVIYPGTPHGFFCPERDTYRPEAADDAWARTLRLLS